MAVSDKVDVSMVCILDGHDNDKCMRFVAADLPNNIKAKF